MFLWWGNLRERAFKRVAGPINAAARPRVGLSRHTGGSSMACSAKRAVLLDDPDNNPEGGDSMEFRLIYTGPLRATQRDPTGGQVDRRADHKHDLRRVFHRQLKRLWEATPFLKSGKGFGDALVYVDVSPIPPDYRIDRLAQKHALYGFEFVPLVTFELNLICGLEILFLRPDKPGDVVWAGDIDNRLKTLLVH